MAQSPSRDPTAAPGDVDSLLDRANRGDSAAQGILFARVQGYVEAQFRRQRTDRGVPPDEDTVRQLVQDAFLRVVTRIAAGKAILGGELGFRAYLRETAWHLWLDHVSNRVGTEIPFPTTGGDDQDGDTFRANPLEHAADTRGDPLDQLIATETRDEEEDLLARRLWACVDALDREYPTRRFKLLLDLQVESWRAEARGAKKTTQTEMARALACSQAAISGRLTELFKLLRVRIEQEA